MPDAIPTGEEVWVRRGFVRRDRPFYCREYIWIFWIFLLASELIGRPLGAILLRILFGRTIDWSGTANLVGINLLVIVLPLFLLTSPALIFYIKRSAFCPVGFYGEQLSPDRLRVFHFLRPPTIVHLAGSEIEVERYFQWYKTVRIVDKERASKIKLSFLTPEEYDRFMQYWNAANPPG